jgi:hypothetical protein
MEDLRPDRFLEDDVVPSDDLGPPPTPVEPPREPGGGPGRRHLFWFAPWFFAAALLVGVERVAMVVASAAGMGAAVQLLGFLVFCGVVLGLAMGGGWWFAKNYER